MAAKRKLTELEGCVLALIRASRALHTLLRSQGIPIVEHTVLERKRPRSIYPLVRRLVRRRLIESHRTPGDRRGGRLYEVTAAGRQALKKWLSPPLSELTVGSPPDPIRTRIGFLRLLSPKSRRAFLDDARNKLCRNLQHLKCELAGKASRSIRSPRAAGKLSGHGSPLGMGDRNGGCTSNVAGLPNPAAASPCRILV